MKNGKCKLEKKFKVKPVVIYSPVLDYIIAIYTTLRYNVMCLAYNMQLIL
jgi:hypothetical protein